MYRIIIDCKSYDLQSYILSNTSINNTNIRTNEFYNITSSRQKGLFTASIHCDRITDTKITFTSTCSYCNINMICFGRYSIYGYSINSDSNGNFFGGTKSNIVATTSHIFSTSGKNFTITVPAWDDLEIIGICHSSFTLSVS